ncbi:MAG: hypothetical protein EOO04_02090 [Chitinophagaceae bacterium]|nr:MAG: hypothetical protein EOO04_02090 [Chitinophagaceae bacterium]
MKKILAAVLVMFAAFAVNAQEEAVEKTGFDRSRLFAGGNFALNFGSITIVNISPQLGYRFNRYLAAGVGVNAQYSSFRTLNAYDGSTFSRENFGVGGLNIFGRFYPIDQVILQVQPEANYVWGKVKYYNPAQEVKLDGKIVPSVLVGAGGAIPMGGAGAFIVMAQYDLLQNERTPYGNKIFFNFGYNFGL